MTDSASTPHDGGLAVVTGGGGFIGRHLVAELAAAGHRVRILDPAPAAVADCGARAEVIQGSVLDRSALERALAGADWCFHLAAIAWLWQRDRTRYDRVNRVGTEAVLDACAREGVARCVVTASEAIYAARSRRAVDPPITEDTPIPEPGELPGPYTRSKVAAAHAALAARAAGQPVVLAIPTTPLGPGDHNLTPPTRMLADLLAGRLPAYLACTLDLVDVRAVARGHLRIAQLADPADRYLLAGEGWPLDELLQHAAACAGVRAPRRRVPPWLAAVAARVQQAWADRISGRMPAASVEGVRLARRHLVFDAERSRRALDLAPSDAAQAIADAVAWLQREQPSAS